MWWIYIWPKRLFEWVIGCLNVFSWNSVVVLQFNLFYLRYPFCIFLTYIFYNPIFFQPSFPTNLRSNLEINKVVGDTSGACKVVGAIVGQSYYRRPKFPSSSKVVTLFAEYNLFPLFTYAYKSRLNCKEIWV